MVLDFRFQISDFGFFFFRSATQGLRPTFFIPPLWWAVLTTGEHLLQKVTLIAVDGNQQPQNKHKQVDVGQVHRQGRRQVLLVFVGAGQNEKVNH